MPFVGFAHSFKIGGCTVDTCQRRLPWGSGPTATIFTHLGGRRSRNIGDFGGGFYMVERSLTVKADFGCCYVTHGSHVVWEHRLSGQREGTWSQSVGASIAAAASAGASGSLWRHSPRHGRPEHVHRRRSVKDRAPLISNMFHQRGIQ